MSPCDPEVAFQLNDLAISLQYDGDYPAADRMFRRELTTIRSCLGPNHANVATALSNQFTLAREMGSYAEAEKLGQQAVRVWTSSLGPSHPFVAFGLNELADFFASRGDWMRAQRLFERALQIRRRALGPDHPDVARTLVGLAETRASLGDLATARTLLQQAIAVFEKTPPRDPDYLPAALALRGTLDARRGSYRTARSSLEDALARRETSLGIRHPLVASTRADVAAVDLALGSYEQAFSGALTAEESARDLLRFTVRYLPDRRAMDYARARPQGLSIALSVVADHLKAVAPEALDAVIQSRGMVLDELAARARAVSVADSQTESLVGALADARRRFAALALRSFEGQAAEPALIERVRRRKKTRRRRWLRRAPSSGRSCRACTRGWPMCAARCRPGPFLFRSCGTIGSRSPRRRGRIRRRTVPSYMAFVSWSDRPGVESVPLGAAASLEELISSWREDAGGRSVNAEGDDTRAEQAYRVTGSRLRQRIGIRSPLTSMAWIASSSCLTEPSTLLVSPRCRHRASGTSSKTSRRFTTCRWNAISSCRCSRPPIAGCCWSGGRRTDAACSTTRAAGGFRNGCTSSGQLRIRRPARFTRRGSRHRGGVVTLASGGAYADAVLLLSGRAATKSAVIDAARGRRILHLATHGFFLSGCVRRRPARVLWVDWYRSRARTPPT